MSSMRYCLLLFGLSMVFSMVNAQAPTAAYTCTPTGHGSLTISCKDQSTGNPTGWVWFFGDENYTEPWTLVSTNAGWTGRSGHSSVVMQDGSIVLMGGSDIVNQYHDRNDTWRSTDKGASWTQVNSSSGWSERSFHTSVSMQDNSIILMGGFDSNYTNKNDTWRSTDKGASWTQVNSSSGWSKRSYHTSAGMPDGSIILMGGWFYGIQYNDVWRSTDKGTTWTRMTESAGWPARNGHNSAALPDGSVVVTGGSNLTTSMADAWQSRDNGATWMQMNASARPLARNGHSSVTMPDGSIVLLGGLGGLWMNDVWRSTDHGATWTQVNSSSGWLARCWQSSVVMPDGSIVMMGGTNKSSELNDTWRFNPSGSSAQNPSHIYSRPGTYQVTLQVYNTEGYTSIRKNITVPSKTVGLDPLVIIAGIGCAAGIFYIRSCRRRK
jgi:PKD repeat protein